MRYNIRASNAAEMAAALLAAGIITEAGVRAGATLDIIGVIRLVGVDGAGNPVVEDVPGYHANLIADLTPTQEDLLPLIPAPANPYRIFAGE